MCLDRLTPSVTWTVCPSVCACHALRAPGEKRTTLTRMRDCCTPLRDDVDPDVAGELFGRPPWWSAGRATCSSSFVLALVGQAGIGLGCHSSIFVPSGSKDAPAEAAIGLVGHDSRLHAVRCAAGH